MEQLREIVRADKLIYSSTTRHVASKKLKVTGYRSPELDEDARMARYASRYSRLV